MFLCTVCDTLKGCVILQDMNSLTVVVMGKGGVGKSSTVNSLIGEQVVRVSPFQVCKPQLNLQFAIIEAGIKKV